MSTILVGMFDSQTQAEAARARLVDAGFPASVLSMTGGSSSMAPSTPSASAAVEPEHEGGITHFFKNLFGADDDASSGAHGDTYREAFRRGSYGLSVTTVDDADTDKAERILNESGAVDIDEKSRQWQAEGWQAPAVSDRAAATGDAQKLQVIDEELKVGKRTVSRGGVRIFSRLTEVPVQETVSLREEHAEVQRRAVDRPATEADFAAFKEGSVEIRDSAEEAVVSKSARVVEEIEVGTEVTQREETVHGTVRQTRVDVERIGDGAGGMAPVGAVGTTHSTGTTATTGATENIGTTGTVPHAGSANLDPITGEPGAHPVGTAVGATAGGVAAGAAAGSVVGPVGTIIGAAAGAVVGGLAGKGVAEKVDPTVPSKR